MVNETQKIEIKDLNIDNCDLIQILQKNQYVQRWKQDELILFLKKKTNSRSYYIQKYKAYWLLFV